MAITSLTRESGKAVTVWLLFLTMVRIALGLTMPVLAQEKKEVSAWTGTLKNGTVINQEDLRKIIQEHWVWLNSEGKEGKRANLIGAYLRETQLKGAELTTARLTEAHLEHSDLAAASLIGAHLEHADLTGVDLTGADLTDAGLTGARLNGAYMTKSNLNKADLGRANLNGADLNGAHLEHADLTGADLTGANLNKAELTKADLAGVVFEPQYGALPDLVSIARANHLSSMEYRHFPHALVELRQAFKKAGFRNQESEVTYAIKHRERRILWDVLDENGNPKTLARLAVNRAESLFNLFTFELPSGYGMSPGRPLLILVGLVFVFSIPYMIALRKGKEENGIWKAWLPERIRKDIGTLTPGVLILRGYKVPLFAIYFSFLRTFSLGWRQFNSGNWISRVQREEYVLRPTGWVRTVSGIQSIISVYLLALWAYAYLGRLFE